MVGISLQAQPRPICLLSVYLPTLTGCTDIFKEFLDYLDFMINLLGYDNDVLILGDINTDLGLGGGPMASTSINEQGKILTQYLKDGTFYLPTFISAPNPATSTYESEAHGSLSTIDHVLCPSHIFPSLSSCHVIEEEPSNNSHHLPLTCQLNTHLPNSPIHRKKNSVNHPVPTGGNLQPMI